MSTTTDTTTTGGPIRTARRGEGPVTRLERDVRGLVPDLVGLTLCRTGPDGPVTLGATSRRMALLDALQTLDGGPAPTRDRDVVLAGTRWPHLARGAAVAGVGSTRACSITDGEVTVGEVHLYAAGDDAFTGRAEALRALLDAADLRSVLAASSPTTDAPTQAAPRSLRGDGAVHRAIGQLAVRDGGDPIAAYARLESAARRGGVDCCDLAAALVDLRP